MTHGAVRVGWGMLLLGAPRRVLARVGHPDADGAPVAVARVLGARHVGQGLVTMATGRRDVLLLGTTADVLHACTAVALAAASPAWRRVGMLDTAVAAGFAATGPR